MAMSLIQAAGASTADASSMIEYVVTYFVPFAQPFLKKYPGIFRLLGILLAVWYWAPFASIQSFWSRFSRFFISTIQVSAAEEDLFHYLTVWIAEQKSLRLDKTLYATSPKNGSEASVDSKPRIQNVDVDARRQHVNYQQSQGVQIFVYQRRIFFTSRASAEGHAYYEPRVGKQEILSISCFGRSELPIQYLIEHVYRLQRERESSLKMSDSA